MSKWAILDLLLLMLPLFLLWLTNLPPEDRHAQFWSPWAVSTFFIVSLLINYFPEFFIEIPKSVALSIWPHFPIEKIRTFFAEIEQFWWLLVNIAILWFFLVVKRIIIFVKARKLRASEQPVLGSRNFAYYQGLRGGIFIRPHFVFAGRFFLLLGAIAIFPLLATLFACFSAVQLPAMALIPAWGVLLLAEWGWYLNGLRPPDEGEGSLSGSDVSPTLSTEYRTLWEKYRKIWPEWVLAFAELHGEPSSQKELLYEIRGRVERSHDVILKGWTPALFAEQLFAIIAGQLLERGRILVVVARAEERYAVAADIRRLMLAHGGSSHAWKIAELLHDDDDLTGADIVVITPDRLLAPGESLARWREGLTRVIIPEVGELFPFIGQLASFCQQRVDQSAGMVGFTLMGGERESFEPGLRGSLPVRARIPEFSLGELRPQRAYVTIWRLEQQPWMQCRLFAMTENLYLGSETILALLAWQQNIANISLSSPIPLPWMEYLEEIDSHRRRLHNRWLSAASLGDKLAWDRLSRPDSLWMESINVDGCLLLRDAHCNLSTALAFGLGRHRGELLLHIVAPPYLLRDYLAENLDFFSRAPLLPLTPMLTDGRLGVALALLERMSRTPVSEERILQLLRRLDNQINYVETGLARLYTDLFGLDPWAINAIGHEIRLVVNLNKAQPVRFYHFKSDFRDRREFAWLAPIQIRTAHGEDLGTISRDHLFQTILPGQVRVYGGKNYIWLRFDDQLNVLEMSHLQAGDQVSEIFYRPHLTITLRGCRPPHHEGQSTDRNFQYWTVHERLCEADFTIHTHGYQHFSSTLRLDNTNHRYVNVDQGVVRPRHYRNGRVFSLRFETAVEKKFNWQGVRYTLAHLLGELLPTFFPETHHLLQITTTLRPGYFTHPCLEQLLPKLELTAEDNDLTLFFFEDSHADIGLARAVQLEWLTLFNVLHDYLVWLIDVEGANAVPEQSKWLLSNPSERKTYLRYGLDEIPRELAIDDTLAFLLSLGCGEANSLTRRRRDFMAGMSSQEDTETGLDRHVCDFCQAEISTTELERLDDGRERCPNCRATAVDTVAGLEEIYHEARAYLGDTLNVNLSRNIDVKLVTATELQAVANEAFVPTAAFDVRAIGLACLQGGACSIFIENGQPRDMTLATIVHELTHIWQYDTINYQRLKSESGLLLIEGLAMWAELSCLKVKKLSPALCEREAARSDIYGQGYRTIIRRQEQSGIAPFKQLAQEYPRA